MELGDLITGTGAFALGAVCWDVFRDKEKEFHRLEFLLFLTALSLSIFPYLAASLGPTDEAYQRLDKENVVAVLIVSIAFNVAGLSVKAGRQDKWMGCAVAFFLTVGASISVGIL